MPRDGPILVGAYLNAATTAVTEMGGKVAKNLGNGLMATRNGGGVFRSANGHLSILQETKQLTLAG
jgi:pseudouridine-5'-phosphate glycosidase